MGIREVYNHFLYRLDKVGTNATQNIGLPQFVLTLDRAQHMWARQRIALAEVTNVVQDSLQSLLVEYSVAGSKSPGGYYRAPLPKDYFHKLRSWADVKGCSGKVYAKWVEEGNLGTLLTGEFTRPSAAWEETLATVSGGEVRIYVEGFDLSKMYLTYFKRPTRPDISGYVWEGQPTTDIDLAFDGADAHEIIDLAVSLAAGDIGDIDRIQTLSTPR
jgi:hypothetical protein